MKSSEEMMNSLLERRRIYNENKGVTGKRGVRSAVISLAVVIVALAGLGVWQLGRANPSPDHGKAPAPHTVADTAEPIQTEALTEPETEPKETEPKETIPYVSEVAFCWPYRSLEEIVDGADYIVRAKNVGHEPSYRDEEGTDRHIYTDYIFEILESFKGDRVVGDKVTVKWYGGELDGEKSVVAGETPINEGQEYILILSHETDENDVPTENDKYMFYPPRGILADDGTGVFTARDPAISFTADGFRAEVEKILG